MSLRTANLQEIGLLLLDSMKEQKRNKSKFVTKFVKTILFSCKNVPQFPRFYNQEFKSILEGKIWFRPLYFFWLRGECCGKKNPSNLSLLTAPNARISSPKDLCYVMLCILYLKSMHKIVYNKKLINIDWLILHSLQEIKCDPLLLLLLLQPTQTKFKQQLKTTQLSYENSTKVSRLHFSDSQ